MSKRSKGSIVGAIIWMFIISLLFFWLPILGPFIAGIVGGKKAGGVGSAIAAVFLPGIVFGCFLFFVAASLSGLPIIGALAGAGGLIFATAHIGPLSVGAVIGGVLA